MVGSCCMPARASSVALLLIALVPPCQAGDEVARTMHPSRLLLSRSTRQLPRTGDPIWTLQLDTPGEPSITFQTVTGRAHRQNADRHRAGTRAPLPPGRYRLGPVEPLGPNHPSELGPIWIGLEPLFPTGRGHLGIHLDPSANRDANSGTLGCVGLIHHRDMVHLARLVQGRNVRELVVLE